MMIMVINLRFGGDDNTIRLHLAVQDTKYCIRKSRKQVNESDFSFRLISVDSIGVMINSDL